MPWVPPTHKPSKEAKPKYQRKNALSAHQRGYTRKWQKVRLHKLSKNPLCEHCENKGITQHAQEVDHIKPISEGGDTLDLNNLQSLCRACHNIKTQADIERRSTMQST